MRRICCLLVILFGSSSSSLGQSAPKFTTPRIVATFERLGQTGDISPITIYTPKKWGTFRVSIVMVGTKANGVQYANWAGEFQFMDGAGEDVPSSFAVPLLTDIRRTAATDFPIRAEAGKPMKFFVNGYGGPEGSKYNVWVVVEQLM
jgi:hypothetical protein